MNYFTIRLRPLLFFVWSFQLGALYYGGYYLTYLSTKLEYYFLFAIGVLFVFFLTYSFENLERKKIKNHAFEWLNCFIFILPLIYLSISYNAQLGSVGVEQRMVRQKAAPLVVKPAIANLKMKDGYGIIDLSILVSEWKNNLGKKVKSKGQLFRGKELPQGYVMVYKFLVTCCMADARPIAILISDTGSLRKISTDEWVEINGKLILRKINEEEALVFDLDNVRKLSKKEILEARYSY